VFWTSCAFYPPFVKSIVAENVFRFKQIIATSLKIQRFPAFGVQSVAFIGPEAKIFLPFLSELACQVGGRVSDFVPKCVFSSGGKIAHFLGIAIFALHNYLSIRQLRLKGPK
jgi:hypothetical protein